MTIKTKLFGEGNYNRDEGLDFDGQTLSLNNKTCTVSVMIFEEIDEADLGKVTELLNNLEELDRVAKNKIMMLSEDEKSIVSAFANEHFNEYIEEVTNAIFKKLNIDKQDNRAFLENMELGQVVVYEHATKGICITLDYNLIWEDGVSFTDQILAISFDADSRFLSIAHES